MRIILAQKTNFVVSVVNFFIVVIEVIQESYIQYEVRRPYGKSKIESKSLI